MKLQFITPSTSKTSNQDTLLYAQLPPILQGSQGITYAPPKVGKSVFVMEHHRLWERLWSPMTDRSKKTHMWQSSRNIWTARASTNSAKWWSNSKNILFEVEHVTLVCVASLELPCDAVWLPTDVLTPADSVWTCFVHLNGETWGNSQDRE